MHAVTRPTLAMTAVAAAAVSSALIAGPASQLASAPASPVTAAVDAQKILLAGFIADVYNSIEPVVADVVGDISGVVNGIPLIGGAISDQIDILFNYGEQAVGDTVYWADDLVTPLVNGNFWPVSGAPGNYLNQAFNSTVNWGEGLINTAVGFVEAEFDYFFGWIPNISDIVNDVINTVEQIANWLNIDNIVNGVIKTVERIVNWVIGWIPGPLAAVAPAGAAATAQAGLPTRVAAGKPAAAAAVAAPAAADAPAGAPVEKPGSVSEETSSTGAGAPAEKPTTVDRAQAGEALTAATRDVRRSPRSGAAATPAAGRAEKSPAGATDNADEEADTGSVKSTRGQVRQSAAGRAERAAG